MDWFGRKLSLSIFVAKAKSSMIERLCFMSTAPVLYISHGSPMRVIERSPARDFLVDLGQSISNIKGIVVISPHWETQGVYYSTSKHPETIHDFYGFSKALYQQQYSVASPQWLQMALQECLSVQNIRLRGVDRGLDHGAWSVLKLMYPSGDIPVAALSLPINHSLETLYQLGVALKELREQGIMIVTTGLATHNLSELARLGEPQYWAVEFIDWLQQKVQEKNMDALFNYRSQAPFAEKSHPTDEHLMPLYIALGAAGEQDTQLIHQSWELRNANNSSWAWGL